MSLTNTSQPKLSAIARAVALTLATAAIGTAVAQTATDKKDDQAPRAKEDTVRLGTITIVGQGDKLGAGQILNEDTVKGRSTVTKDATEKDRATGNSYQALSLLPGVNTFNHDATGLFGGGLNVRGFDATQLGFTINGVPVNDSGSYSVFPQEYVDMENICTQQISQGNPDAESPHVGATGGSVNIVSCDPEEKRRVRVAQTVGQLSLSRTFVRFDSGRFANNMLKTFLSASHTQADKWKGEGGAKRDHFDAAFSLDLSPDHRILGSVMYNKAINNNFQSFTLSQINTLGYFADYSPTFTPGHLTPVNGTAQVETGPRSPQQFYKLALNPFENAIVSVSGSFRLAENTYFKIQPYLWYGYGTGGVQQRALSEKGFLNTTTGVMGAGRDLNGDGDTLDTIIVANSSVTKTNRPGVTAEINHQLGNHALKVGFWYERAQHKQTGPAVAVDANGNPVDQWLRDGRILRPDGSEFNSRNWLTISPAYQAYFSDQFSFMNDRGLLQFGARALNITRKFTNFPNEGGSTINFNSQYTVEKKFNDVLPQLGVRFNLDREQQVFANVGKNFRAPPNFAYAPTNGNVTITNGVAVLTGSIKPETSVTTDIGYRYQSKALTFSATAFNVDFKDRQANAFDPTTLKSIYTNAGKARTRGIELEAGTVPVNGWSAYASLTMQKSKVLNDIRTSASVVLASSGKQFAMTPLMLAGLSVQYSSGPLYARLKAKKTGRQYATLMNDEEVPSYMTAELDAGYRFGDFSFAKNAMVRLNVSNLGNTKYRTPSSNTVLNSTGSNVFYYLGAPRFTSITLSADF
ncbi:TonB-dependent receptor [Casimicrobium huifangae]|uniref:TonB-dependent receptor n=1 Tax=Casimicrobium huifangae TaxID=2591109 RepID=UPI003784D6E3